MFMYVYDLNLIMWLSGMLWKYDGRVWGWNGMYVWLLSVSICSDEVLRVFVIVISLIVIYYYLLIAVFSLYL